MHPLVIFGICAGTLTLCYGAYQIYDTIYEWHTDRKEQREYEEYIRMHNEKNQCIPVTLFDNDDTEDEEDEEPLGIWKEKRDSLNGSELRHRKVHTNDHELSEMERSISSRRSLLDRESELLREEEAELERRRQWLRSKGNSITGLVYDDKEDEHANPFSDDFFVEPKPLKTTELTDDDDGWSDCIHDVKSSQKSDSEESFESIHHNKL